MVIKVLHKQVVDTIIIISNLQNSIELSTNVSYCFEDAVCQNEYIFNSVGGVSQIVNDNYDRLKQ